MADPHHHAASEESLATRVITVSTTRTDATDASGAAIAAKLEAAGHRVLERQVISDDAAAIAAAVARIANDGVTRVLILTGGTGVSRTDVTPDALDPLFDRTLPGFGELFRAKSFATIGAMAMLSRATAGLVGGLVVFALPGSPAACELALDELILPSIRHLVGELGKEGLPTPGVRAAVKPTAAPARPEPKKPEPPPQRAAAPKAELPAPTGSLGRLGRNAIGVGATQDAPTAAGGAPGSDGLPLGWKRATYEIQAEVKVGGWSDLPESLEKIAPVVEVLQRAGERGSMTLPSGKVYRLYGYPDLQGNGSKVVAIADGEPFAEIVALHRYPVLTGLLVDAGGLLPSRSTDAAKACEAVTGRAPRDTSGQVLAVQGDAVWIERNGRGFRWNGGRESDDGTVKQVIATALLGWTQR